jgi:hypothetical protein
LGSGTLRSGHGINVPVNRECSPVLLGSGCIRG